MPLSLSVLFLISGGFAQAIEATGSSTGLPVHGGDWGSPCPGVPVQLRGSQGKLRVLRTFLVLCMIQEEPKYFFLSNSAALFFQGHSWRCSELTSGSALRGNFWRDMKVT